MKSALRSFQILPIFAFLVASPLFGAQAAKVSGVVTLPDKTPLQGVHVFFDALSSDEYNEYQRSLGVPSKRAYGSPPDREVKTNKKGNFAYNTLAHGAYRIRGVKEGYLMISVRLEMFEGVNRVSWRTIQIGTDQEVSPIYLTPGRVATYDIKMVPESEYGRATEKAALRQEAAEENLLITGQTLIVDGKYEEALEALNTALEDAQEKEKPDIYFHQGRAYIKLKNLFAGELSFQKVLELNSTYEGASYLLGNLYFEQGNFPQAVAAYQRELELDPNSVKSYLGLATSYRKLNKLEEAATAYEKVIELDPNNVVVYSALADIYGQLGLKQKMESILAQKSQVSGGDPKEYFNLGATYENEGDYAHAVEAYAEAVRLDPNYAKAHQRLGYAYLNQGNFPKAIEHLEQYVSLRPDAPDAAQIKQTVAALKEAG